MTSGVTSDSNQRGNIAEGGPAANTQKKLRNDRVKPAVGSYAKTQTRQRAI